MSGLYSDYSYQAKGDDRRGCQELNLSQPFTRQIPSLLSYCSGPGGGDDFQNDNGDEE